MKLPPFQLERYFAEYEFNTEFLLSSSDCESMPAGDLLRMEPEAASEFQRLWLGYTESLGNPLLRQEISRLYSGLKPENILVHTGAEEAIFVFLNAILEKGDHLIVQWPCYQSLFEVANTIGCQITKWTGQPSDGWRLDLDFLKKNLQANTRAVIINCPHNPTGYLMAGDDWQEINRLAVQFGFLLFSDEVYHFLEYRAADRLPPACELNDRAVTLNVLSKSFGLAGLRTGWIATQNKQVYQLMAGMKDYTTICNSAPSEYLSILALQHREAIIQRNRDIIAVNLSLLDTFFDRYRDLFRWNRPIAGPIAFPQLTGGRDAEPFCRDLVEKAGVLLLPGHLYGEEYRSHFRIGFGRKNMPEALKRLELYLDQVKR